MKTQTFLIRCEYPDGDHIPTQEFVENIQEYFAANIMDGERGRLVVKPVYQPKEEGLVEEENKPKFKIGDRIKRKGDIRLTTIKDIKDNYYIITIADFFGNAYITDKLLFSNQNEYELFPNKFDITNLRPFDKVLVRGDVGQKWTLDFFGFMDKDKGYPFVCVGHYIIQCIPYEGNECLLGTTNDCDDFYKTWK